MSIAIILDTPGMTQEQYEIAHQLLSNTVEARALVHNMLLLGKHDQENLQGHQL